MGVGDIEGVRPSSGAARQLRLLDWDSSKDFRTFQLAVAGDGHTPTLARS